MDETTKETEEGSEHTRRARCRRKKTIAYHRDYEPISTDWFLAALVDPMKVKVRFYQNSFL